MGGWQATSSSAIKEYRRLDAFRQLTQWFGGIAPPDRRTRHNDGTLGLLQSSSRFMNLLGIGSCPASCTIIGRFAWIEKRIGIREVIQDIHRHFEKDRSGFSAQHLA